MREIVEALKALSDTTRLKILMLVANRELCVCELTEVLGVTSSCISQHLSKLKATGFVSERREAQWVYYRATPEALRTVTARLNTLMTTPLAGVVGMSVESQRLSQLSADSKANQCRDAVRLSVN